MITWLGEEATSCCVDRLLVCPRFTTLPLGAGRGLQSLIMVLPGVLFYRLFSSMFHEWVRNPPRGMNKKLPRGTNIWLLLLFITVCLYLCRSHFCWIVCNKLGGNLTGEELLIWLSIRVAFCAVSWWYYSEMLIYWECFFFSNATGK